MAESDDAEPLIALDTYAQDHPERAVEIGRWIGSGACHIAILDGQVVGYVSVTRSFIGHPFVEMLMVARNARRHGVGTHLLEHARTVFPSEKLWVSTNKSNMPMRSLLTGAGFADCGVVHGLDPGDPELFFMREPLGPKDGIAR